VMWRTHLHHQISESLLIFIDLPPFIIFYPFSRGAAQNPT